MPPTTKFLRFDSLDHDATWHPTFAASLAMGLPLANEADIRDRQGDLYAEAEEFERAWRITPRGRDQLTREALADTMPAPSTRRSA